MAAILSINGMGGAHWPGHAAPAGAPVSRTAARDGRYDQFALSAEPEGEGRFRMDLVSRLSQEVRASTTTGEIQELRRQVQSTEYRPDAADIAARMLLMKGVDVS